MDELLEEELQEESIEVDLDRLTPCARAALDRGAGCARAFGDPFVGTDHVLIGLAQVENGAAWRVLASLNASADDLNARMLFIRGGQREPVEDGVEQALSPRLLRVLELAAKDASKRNHAEIGTLHVLSGLLRERTGLAAFLLESPGVGHGRAGSAINLAHREGWLDGETA
jgi:ATP-dependent Clp protease ATP-binding subunit ClpC